MLAARLFRLIDTLTLPGVVPLAGVTASQFPPAGVDTAALNGNAPALLALIVRLCAAGSEPWVVRLKVSDVGSTVRVGSALTLKVTGMVTGLLEAPAEA